MSNQRKPNNGIYSFDMRFEDCARCGGGIEVCVGWDDKEKQWLCGDCVEKAVMT